MKKYFKILLLLSLSVFTSVNAQDNQEIDRLAKKMFVDMNNRDYDAILEMTHPKVFELASKEQMKGFIKGMFEGNSEFTLDVPKMVPEYKLSKIFKEEKDNLSYAFISYDMMMQMTFNNQEFDDESKNLMSSVMKAKGMDVKFVSNNSMKVDMKDRVTILMKDNSTENKWVMINYDSDSPFFYQILPSSLLEKAKDYKQDLMIKRKKESEK